MIMARSSGRSGSGGTTCTGSLDKQARGGRCLVQPMTATTRLTTEARSLYGH
uniref:Uncharacterized protein n=2 Tax=Aegilops tauschii subsp. strangulata TaxID=200361 RepID=A0A453I3M0_AEGTS